MNGIAPVKKKKYLDFIDVLLEARVRNCNSRMLGMYEYLNTESHKKCE